MIGQKTIWTEVRGQALLGEEGFVEKFADYLKKHKDVPEIPRSQRYTARPPFEKIFNEKVLANMVKRNKAVVTAVEEHGYRQREIADHLGMYFTSISRLLRRGKS